MGVVLQTWHAEIEQQLPPPVLMLCAFRNVTPMRTLSLMWKLCLQGSTAVHIAVKRGCVAAAELLLQNITNVNTEDYKVSKVVSWQ